MGCHTWFKVPLVKDKEEIKRLALEEINRVWENREPAYHSDYKKVIQYAIDNNLEGFYGDYAAITVDGRYLDGAIYIDIKDYSLREYNQICGTNYTSPYDKEGLADELEWYSDEPRIGGYPTNIIRSYGEMLAFMHTGYDAPDGTHYDFYYDEDRRADFLEGIRKFFYRHPDGYICFG